MMLNFIHVVFSGNGMEKFGRFKLRGVCAQFIEALNLYCLVAKSWGVVSTNDLHWAIHGILEALLKPIGLGTRPVDCPTDQMVFLWAFLSSNRYRILKDISSLISGCKFGFQCIQIHAARVQSQKKNKGSPFYNSTPGSEGSSESREEEGLEALPPQEGGQHHDAAADLSEVDLEALLEKAKQIGVKDIMDLDVPSKDLESTPYGCAAQIWYTILPYTCKDGTATHLNISRDGQTASYSKDGVAWQSINYGMWSTLILKAMSMIKEEVDRQMPSSMAASEVKSQLCYDDLSRVAPHKQEANKAHMGLMADTFRQKMASPDESKHHLFKGSTPDDSMLEGYVMRDQKIKGLLCTLLTSCSAVPMHPWQFGSIAFDSCHEAEQNVWVVEGCFVIGKPRAKQLDATLAATVFWLPQGITSSLIALLYYQQPFISSLLVRKVGHNPLYASHVWALPSIRPCSTYPMVWNGQDISQRVRSLTEQLIGSPVDPPLAHQSSQGLLREKVPVLCEVFQSCHNLHLEEGSYANQPCLEAYAAQYGLVRLAHTANLPVHRVSACLAICHIWQSMHGIRPADPTWQSMVAGSYIFPTTAHDALAYIGAQSLRMALSTGLPCIFDQDSLTEGAILLANTDLLAHDKAHQWALLRKGEGLTPKQVDAGISRRGAAAGHCLLKTIHTVLFGEGGLRYGQTPPIGGVLRSDLAKAGAMILYTGARRDALLLFGDALKDGSYLGIYMSLLKRWGTDEVPWVAVSTAIFDICPTAGSKVASGGTRAVWIGQKMSASAYEWVGVEGCLLLANVRPKWQKDCSTTASCTLPLLLTNAWEKPQVPAGSHGINKGTLFATCLNNNKNYRQHLTSDLPMPARMHSLPVQAGVAGTSGFEEKPLPPASGMQEKLHTEVHLGQKATGCWATVVLLQVTAGEAPVDNARIVHWTDARWLREGGISWENGLMGQVPDELTVAPGLAPPACPLCPMPAR
ncbi:hypothetical protein H4582DRAFT_2164376 [Lactarius indigo]|nr:hypothetical protein H4582DRAFT_2164376 [Lactarius indigo]